MLGGGGGSQNLLTLCYLNFLKSLKGQYQETFETFIYTKKNPAWAPNEQAITVSRNFSFSRRYSTTRRTECQYSQRLHAVTVLVYSTTTRTRCQRSQRSQSIAILPRKAEMRRVSKRWHWF